LLFPHLEYRCGRHFACTPQALFSLEAFQIKRRDLRIGKLERTKLDTAQTCVHGFLEMPVDFYFVCRD